MITLLNNRLVGVEGSISPLQQSMKDTTKTNKISTFAPNMQLRKDNLVSFYLYTIPRNSPIIRKESESSSFNTIGL